MIAAPQRGLPGTRPEGVRDEAEAAAHVREMSGDATTESTRWEKSGGAGG